MSKETLIAIGMVLLIMLFSGFGTHFIDGI